ncbi:hypothetical protein [Kineosporia sp. A_224]|uniref:hypothetical protein n=1 Tax=Kineosporia sp. A_224 TaxID=1962180 RepID=UPI000B4BAE58|nr:hypothetical protein [Kineosporia sp. A_224]
MNDLLYPEPPHLTASVVAAGAQEDQFSRACTVAVSLGCTGTGAVVVAPWEQSFEFRFHLEDLAARQDLSPGSFDAVVSGADTTRGRPILAGFRHPTWGVVLVEYLPSGPADQHPIGVTVAADALGIPESLWSSREKTRARKLAAWIISVLTQLVDDDGVLYGALGIELRLPSPTALAGGDAVWASSVYVPDGLADGQVDVPAAFQEALGDAVSLGRGRLYCGWAPLSGGGEVVPDFDTRLRRPAILLGSSAAAALLSRP